MAILTPTELKSLQPKAREYEDTALQIYLDKVERRIVDRIGPVNGDSVHETTEITFANCQMPWDLERPLRQVGPTRKTSVLDIFGEREDGTREDIPNSMFYVVRDRRLVPVYSWGGYGKYLTVVYNAESKMDEVKPVQAQLVVLDMIEDGIIEIEDGEYVEKRGESIGAAYSRIMMNLVSGASFIGGG